MMNSTTWHNQIDIAAARLEQAMADAENRLRARGVRNPQPEEIMLYPAVALASRELDRVAERCRAEYKAWRGRRDYGVSK